MIFPIPTKRYTLLTLQLYAQSHPFYVLIDTVNRTQGGRFISPYEAIRSGLLDWQGDTVINYLHGNDVRDAVSILTFDTMDELKLTNPEYFI